MKLSKKKSALGRYPSRKISNQSIKVWQRHKKLKTVLYNEQDQANWIAGAATSSSHNTETIHLKNGFMESGCFRELVIEWVMKPFSCRSCFEFNWSHLPPQLCLPTSCIQLSVTSGNFRCLEYFTDIIVFFLTTGNKIGKCYYPHCKNEILKHRKSTWLPQDNIGCPWPRRGFDARALKSYNNAFKTAPSFLSSVLWQLSILKNNSSSPISPSLFIENLSREA